MVGWMINCKEYAEMTSRSMDRRLSLWERLTMKLHQMLCPPCNLIRKQFVTLRNACRFSSSAGDSTGNGQRLSDEVCERIKSVLRKASRDKETP